MDNDTIDPAGAGLIARADAMRADLGGPPPPPGSPGETPPPPVGMDAASLELEIAGIFDMSAEAVGEWLPSVRATMDDEVCKRLGERIAPVLIKYGWDRYVVGGAWVPEVMALIAIVSTASAVAKAVKHDLGQMKAGEQPKAAATVPEATGNAAEKIRPNE